VGIELITGVRLPRGLVACLRFHDERKLIEVAARQPLVRQRFSIAHELGHFCLGHSHQDDSRVAEQEANIFAGGLLVPRAWLKRDIKTIATVVTLAERYEVSREVMFIALKDARLLGLVR
jgi:Zn-dependent peptidase ImmA (M78 family)